MLFNIIAAFKGTHYH